MEKKMYKLSFVNKGNEFELPDPTKVGTYKKLLEIEAKVETKYQELKQDTKNYNQLVATESNFETTYQILNHIDKAVTREDIEKMDGLDLSKFVLALYRIDEKDFPKAVKETTEPPKKDLKP